MPGDAWAIIANPAAGRRRALACAEALAESARRSGAAATVAATSGPGNAEDLARDAVSSGATRVVACGGDGTVHEVVNGIKAADADAANVAFGVVPCGRCNDFSFALGLPKDPDEAAASLVDSPVRVIDLGLIGERYFATIATLGFDSEVGQYVDQGSVPSYLRGAAAYLYGAVVKLAGYRAPWVALRWDSGEYSGDFFMAATANTARYGGRIRIAPSALLDDGLLDVCLVQSVTRLQVLRMMPTTFYGGHVKHPAVSIHKTRRLEIDSRDPLPVWADGEPITHTPATIEVVPQGLSVLSPSPS